MSNDRVKLPLQRTGESVTVTTAKGFDHLVLHDLSDATSATRHEAVIASDVLAVTPPAIIDLTKIDTGNVQHPDRSFKHKVRAGTIAMRNRTTDRFYSIAAGFADAIDDGVDWLSSTFDPDETEGRVLMEQGIYSLV